MNLPRPRLDFDPNLFERHYERRPFFLRHDLAEHPLLSVPALLDLARRLPPGNVELNAGDVPTSLAEDRRPAHALTAEETLHRIRECKSWLGLKQVEQVPEYRFLVDALLDQLEPMIDPLFPRMYGRAGFIFVTSPRSTVPYHMDPEHNFLFQIRGGKTFTIFDKTDRELVPEMEIERHYTRDNRKMVLRPEHRPRGCPIPLAPGDALHVPINAPHFVENDGEVSVSMSVTFRTPRSDRREVIYVMNHNIRRLGLAPTPFGASRARDLVKLGAYRAYRAARSVLVVRR
jgi:ribosomal protein L16 Arg81 hydroxylase